MHFIYKWDCKFFNIIWWCDHCGSHMQDVHRKVMECWLEYLYVDGTQRIMVDKVIETSMYTNLTKNDVKNDTNKDKMDNTAYVQEIM